MFNRYLPIYLGGGAVALIAVGGIVVAAIRGGLTGAGLGAAIACVVGVLGVGVLIALQKRDSRMPNRVPGFGLCYGGDGGARTVDEHSRFLSDLVIEWQLRIGPTAELLETLAWLDVEWRPGETFVDGIATVRGVTRGPSHVVVATRPGRTIGATALAHEIVHAHLWRTTGDPDPGHKKFHRYDPLIEALRVR